MDKGAVTVSVCIPAYNEEKNIAKTLESVLAENTPNGFEVAEIIVVSDGSTDGTETIVKNFIAKDRRIRMYSLPKRRGYSYSFNIFVDNSAGDIILVINSDTVPLKGFLTRLLTPLSDGSIGACVGRALPINSPVHFWGYCARVLYKWNYSSAFLRVDFEGGCALRRSLLSKVDHRIGDTEAQVTHLIRNKGYKISLTRDSCTLTKFPDNLFELIKQSRRNFLIQQLAKRAGYETAHSSSDLRIRAFVAELRAEVSSVNKLRLLFLGALLLFSFVLAKINSIVAKEYVTWKPIQSTKILH